MSAHDLNTADYSRIEAALRVYIDTAPENARPEAMRSIARTLDKIERINATGDYTVQWPGGPTLRELRRTRELKEPSTA